MNSSEKTNRIKILLVEDNYKDAELINEKLNELKADHQIILVKNKKDFNKNLRNNTPDIILSKLEISNHFITDLLNDAKLKYPSVPIVFIIDPIKEKNICEILKLGEIDYIDKNDLSNLVPVFNRIIYKININTDRKEIYKELNEKDELNKALVELSLDGIFIENLKGDILDCNPAGCEMFGYKKEEIIIKNIKDLVPDEFANTLPDEITEDFLTGHKFVERINKRKDGSLFPTEIHTRFYVKNGEKRLIAYIRDISERKKQEEEKHQREEEFRALIENSPDIILRFDKNFNRIYSNSAFNEYTLNETNKYLGNDINRSRVAKLHKDKLTSVLKKVLETKTETEIEFDFNTKNGKRYFNARLVPEFNGNGDVSTLLSVARDVTERKKAEIEKIQSERKYRYIFENSPIGIFQTELSGKIITANKSFAHILGVSTPEDLMNNYNMRDFYYNSLDRSKLVKNHISLGFVRTKELKWRKIDGTIIWVNLDALVFTRSDGTDYFEGFVWDITENKKHLKSLMESEAKFKDLANLLPQPVFEADNEGNLTFANQAAFREFDYNKEEFDQGLSIFDMMIPEHIQIAMNRLNTEEYSVKPKGYEYTAKRKDGTTFPSTIYISKIEKDNKFLGIRGIIIDITEKKKFIQEIIEAKEDAEEANRLKSGFLSSMSHEIRTPLNVILGISSILRESLYKNSNDEYKDLFNSMDEAGKRLLNTITQILDISRIEANEFEINIEDFSAKEIAIKNYKLLKKIADEKNLNFILNLPEDDFKIKADEYCLNGALTNVISNSIKYSYKGNISFCIYKNSDKAVFKITDEGIGMSPDYQKHLYKTFSQEETGTKRKFEGTGLGLAITKRYIDMMNCEIDIKSEKNKGTEVTIKIPLS